MSKSWSGRFPPPSKPLAVEGGLAARSARGAIGEHWWSRRFLEVLESFALGSRLTRGKNYARRGQVVSLSVAPGAVIASVQGSRRTPYEVTIALPSFSELVWSKVEISLVEQAIHSARLLAGEMPPDLEEVFAAAGAPLFPRTVAELTMRCSCPDREVPCKHLAATFYLLAERFDDDPFQILHWRGRPREVLLGRLRELRSDEPVPATGSDSQVEVRVRVGAAMALVDLVVGDQDFWSGIPVPALPVHPDLPVDLLLRQLPEPGALLGGAKFAAHLPPLYARLADAP